MDTSEDLDLDSLMELLGDSEENDLSTKYEKEINSDEAHLLKKDNSEENIISTKSDEEDTDEASLQKKTNPKACQKTAISAKPSLSEVDLFTPEKKSSSEKNAPSHNHLTTPSGSCPNPKSRLQSLKSGFKNNFLDPQRVENPRKEEVCNRPSFNKRDSAIFNHGDLGSSDEEVEQTDKDYLTKTGKFVKKELEAKQIPSYREPKKQRTATTWKRAPKTNSSSSLNKTEEAVSVDSFSGIRIINPLVSFSALQERMKDRRMIKMSFIQNFIKGGDIEGDWVTMGVLIGKVPTKTSKNGQPYSIWKMSDLHDVERSVSVFLFKTAHTEHWKTTVGTVVGILNAQVMANNNSKSGELNLAIDHPGKFLLMGKSKDLGFCKSVRRDGTPCNMAVNKFQCEFCAYHVKKEYKKFSAKRSDIQAAFNGREPSLKDRLLKKSNVFYGGQSFTASEKKPSNNLKFKDKLTLSTLGLKRKASEALDSVEKEKGVKKLAEMYGPNILPVANNNSEFINVQLAKPTVGSRNLLHHLMKDKINKEAEQKMISQKELLKMRDQQMTARGVLQQHKKSTLQTPMLGRGLAPGQKFNLEISPSVVGRHIQNQVKMKAIQKIHEQGKLKRKDPNSVKVSDKSSEKVKAVLDKSLEEEGGNEKVLGKSTNEVVKSTLGSIDINSEKVKNILKRGSSHAYEVEMKEMMKEAAYFNNLEKKEQMEEKMTSTKEIVCDVVSCLKCKYTAHTSSQRCKEERHPIKCHKALKRFFQCADCKWRTFAFSRLPRTMCRNCHGSSFESTSMMQERKGPKLENEVLNICADEKYFIESLTSL